VKTVLALPPTNILTTLTEAREGGIREAAALRKEAERPPRRACEEATGAGGGHK